ncbi:MAG: hypothetical protein LLF98_10485 [Clostridium sp.]|uniref:hypothetical protein n=1 Tax=Clostridium sp. TaxID=1506 RepID=UPI0025C5224D|nr:hypothetical protein [Clostridium sp.]MCE5221665.1 hypothetical protein [Clostridium sp.]
MSDVQEIMNEMENLNKEIATTADEPVVEGAPLSAGDDPTIVLGTSCCVVPLPDGFAIPSSITLASNLRIGYNLNKLECFVTHSTLSATTTCNTVVNVTGWAVRMVGCISYLVNLYPITATPGISRVCNIPADATQKLSLCCSNNICVDQCIALLDTEDAAKALCDRFSAIQCVQALNPPTTTSIITPSIGVLQIPLCSGNSNAVQFTVSFSLSYV